MSHEICLIAGMAVETLPMEQAMLRHRSEPLLVHPITRVGALSPEREMYCNAV
jgi:hypothetical protein